MKRLLLVRHGESEDHALGGDHGRALTAAGAANARRLGEAWAGTQEADRILVSSARRTQETAEGLCSAAGISAPLEVIPALYLASSETLCLTLESLDREVQCAMIVAHNPGLGALVHHLTGHPERFRPGTAVELELHLTDWNQLGPECAQVRRRWAPDGTLLP